MRDPQPVATTALSSAASERATRPGVAVPRPLRVAAFNALPRLAAIEHVRSCLEVERWWTAVVDARPYADLESLLLVARQAADPFSDRELDLAVAGHLGVREVAWLPPIETDRYGAEASADVLRERIAEDSRAYLARFGRPFVIRAAGRSTPDVARHLHRRLGLDDATDSRATAAALRQIGLLALVRRVGG